MELKQVTLRVNLKDELRLCCSFLQFPTCGHPGELSGLLMGVFCTLSPLPQSGCLIWDPVEEIMVCSNVGRKLAGLDLQRVYMFVDCT